MRNENLLFIGFMGCGKSSVARALALDLKRVFFDSDDLIELKFKLSIKEIFQKYGEDFFRKEERLLADFFAKTSNAIIASGGGFYKNANLKEIGKIIYLEADFDFLKNRLSKDELLKRPLFSDEKHARALFEERIDKYKSLAQQIINVENKSIETIKDEIKKGLI